MSEILYARVLPFQNLRYAMNWAERFRRGRDRLERTPKWRSLTSEVERAQLAHTMTKVWLGKI